MSAINQKIARLNAWADGLIQVFNEIILSDEIQELSKMLNTEKQLSEGLRSDGTVLPDYSPVSVNVYGKPPGAIKLHDTGDFYASHFTRFTGSAVFVDFKDEKTAELKKRYGNLIAGIMEENLPILWGKITEVYERKRDQFFAA